MLSIIIPTLNEEGHLPLLLESIKSQDFSDYEIIVADAGSTDQTLQIAKKYGCQIAEGGLPSKARNNGAKVAKGDILLFIDADITLSSHFLKNAVLEFEKRGLGIAGFPIILVTKDVIDKIINHFFNIFTRYSAPFSPHSLMAIMASKKVHDSISGFDETVLLFEDLYYTRMMAKRSKYGYIRCDVFSSDRRYRKDGKGIYVKYFLAELYTIFIGPIRTNIFNYKFNHYRDKKK